MLDCFIHLQILAQVKRAYEHGIEPEAPDSGKPAGQSGKVVSRMLNTAVSAGKRVRSETGISKGAVSISSAAAEFTEMKVKDDCAIQNGLEGANICIIGAGKMARLLLVHLQVGLIFIEDLMHSHRLVSQSPYRPSPYVLLLILCTR